MDCGPIVVVVFRAHLLCANHRTRPPGSGEDRALGLVGWAKKNQCHPAVAKRASHRSRASTIGHTIEDGKVGDRGGIIHGGAERAV